MSGNTPRSALVTGGSRGIGRATALRLAANGHRVAVNYNSHPEEADAVVEEIRAAGGTAISIGGDVSDKESVVAMIDQAVEAHGPIEILINNAGVINDSLLMRMKDEQFEYTMNVNMYGTYYCTHKVIPGMVKGRWGRIINVSSVVGMRGNIGQSNYSASKAAVFGFTQSIAKEVATRGITVNVVAPGYITTATSADISDRQRDFVLTWIPQGRFGEPDEVAPTIVFLTTDDAQYITGDIIRVDGGMALWRRHTALSDTNTTDKNLAGKIALVTGGSRGIGKAIALELGRRGATVIINYLKNHDAAKATVEELEAVGIQATRIKAHIGDEAAVQSLVGKIEDQFGRLDILINNAASGVMRSADELSAKHWDWTLNINARGPWMLSVAAARLMPEGGRIINLSSPGATRVLPAYFAVGVSKAAIEAVTRYLAVELGPKGIAVNTVSAGFVMTDAIDAFPEELGVKELASRATPAGRAITPTDVSNVVAMLCSTDAEMIRGQVIMVDGGETLRHR